MIDRGLKSQNLGARCPDFFGYVSVTLMFTGSVCIFNKDFKFWTTTIQTVRPEILVLQHPEGTSRNCVTPTSSFEYINWS